MNGMVSKMTLKTAELRPADTWSQMNQARDTDMNSASSSVSFDMMLGV